MVHTRSTHTFAALLLSALTLWGCDCGGQKIAATYINAGDNSLAVLKMGDRVVVTVAVLAASGAKYAGQELIWWTKGDEATLYDLHNGENDPGKICRKFE